MYIYKYSAVQYIIIRFEVPIDGLQMSHPFHYTLLNIVNENRESSIIRDAFDIGRFALVHKNFIVNIVVIQLVTRRFLKANIYIQYNVSPDSHQPCIL